MQVFRYKQSPTEDMPLFAIAGGVMMLGVTVISRFQSEDWVSVIGAALFLLLGASFFAFFWRERRRRRMARICIDAEKEALIFEHVRFDTSFWPEWSPGLRVVPFSDLIEVKEEGVKRVRRLMIRTAQGRVAIDQKLTGFDEFLEAVRGIIADYERSPGARLGAEANEPRVETPFWAWLVISSAIVATIAGAVWTAVK